jgi:hypothetical protein
MQITARQSDEKFLAMPPNTRAITRPALPDSYRDTSSPRANRTTTAAPGFTFLSLLLSAAKFLVIGFDKLNKKAPVQELCYYL